MSTLIERLVGLAAIRKLGDSEICMCVAMSRAVRCPFSIKARSAWAISPPAASLFFLLRFLMTTVQKWTRSVSSVNLCPDVSLACALSPS